MLSWFHTKKKNPLPTVIASKRFPPSSPVPKIGIKNGWTANEDETNPENTSENIFVK